MPSVSPFPYVGIPSRLPKQAVAGTLLLLLPMILITKNEKMTLPVMMATLRAATDINANQGAIYLSVAISVVPILLVFAFFSKYIMQRAR